MYSNVHIILELFVTCLFAHFIVGIFSFLLLVECTLLLIVKITIVDVYSIAVGNSTSQHCNITNVNMQA